MRSGDEYLRVSNVSMTFDGVTVLHDFDMSVDRGEIHALLGQNGSGKSTLIKILSGFYFPDPGAKIRIGDDTFHAMKVGEVARHGVAFVHQDLGLVDSMSIADNLAIGDYVTTAGWRIDWKTQRAKASALLAEFGLFLDVTRKVDQVENPAERALIAIARAVESVRHHSGGGLLVLDEPTAYLPQEEVAKLQEAIKSLASRGIGIIYVTHKLDELAGFVDRATILRDGCVVGVVDVADEDPGSIVRLIIGHDLEVPAASPAVVDALVDSEIAVSVADLSGTRVRDLSMSVKRGEILGLTGLVGMGQEEVSSLLFGASPHASGEVSVAGHQMLDLNPRSSIEAGVVFIPSNRALQGVSLHQTVVENVSLPAIRNYFRRGRLRRREEVRCVAEQLRDFKVTPALPKRIMASLSGGNQQKAVLAKWLQLRPDVVLVDEPTQGIDVGAREEIMKRLRALAAQGTAVIVASSEHDDLVALCHRVLVFRDGRVVAEMKGGEIGKESLLHFSSYGHVAEPFQLK